MKDAYRGFLGRGWHFPPVFDVKSGDVADVDEGNVLMVEEEADIKQSLYILFTTIPGERMMRPEYGCDLHSQVFSQINTTTKTLIKGLIADAILYFEPRITLENIWFEDREEEAGVLDIHIEYTVRKTNTRTNIVYPFYHAEGTNVEFL